MCNGYGIWINKDELRWDLITFNRLPEPWRASPESWHLSRYYYIYNSKSFIHVENISWELALNPGYYKINVRPGNNRIPRTRHSHPRKHPLSALFRTPQVSPGESTHIPRTSVSPEVNTACLQLFFPMSNDVPGKSNGVSRCNPAICRCYNDICRFSHRAPSGPTIGYM